MVCRTQHVSYIDETNNTLLWLTAVHTRMSIFDTIYRNLMNSTKIKMYCLLHFSSHLLIFWQHYVLLVCG